MVLCWFFRDLLAVGEKGLSLSSGQDLSSLLPGLSAHGACLTPQTESPTLLEEGRRSNEGRFLWEGSIYLPGRNPSQRTRPVC